jgi:light-regulated signal transduction histidine kinase (bacteriophytochrome)
MNALLQQTVLIVDECAEDRETYRRALLQDDRYTYQILEAEDGATGLALCAQNSPDVVLLDDGVGLDFLNQLNAQNGRVSLPIVVLTRRGDAAIAIQVMKQGAQDYLLKSEVTPQSLCLAVHNAVERMRLIVDLNRAQTELRHQQERSQLFAEITLKLRRSLQSDEILQTAVTEVQQLLKADRVLVFRLWADGSGKVVQESVVPGYTVVLGRDIYDPCFPGYRERYRQGRVNAITNVETADISLCHLEFLRQFEVKANLVVPVLMRDSLWGLLIAHQCSSPRQWVDSETDLLQQLANQIGIALSQAELLETETRQREELARSNAELERFAYVASHDLQEPLRMVTSYLQLLEQLYADKLDAEANEFIHYAVDGAARMRSLIQDLLSYSRVNTKEQIFESVDCSVLLGRAIANLQIAIEESGAMITGNPLPEVRGDASQLTQLFQNLVSNAIKFRDPTRPLQIQINASRQEREWLFEVRDNGIGIEPQYRDRIFLLFQRLHHRADYPGTGIGLAVCKKIVERHGGRLWVESQPDQGSRFYFTIADQEIARS